MAYRKTVRHFHEVGHLHELTFSCSRRMPLLTNNAWREKHGNLPALAEPVAHNSSAILARYFHVGQGIFELAVE